MVEIESLFVLLLNLRCVDSSSSVLSNSLLEKVGFALERDHLHPLERVLDLVKFRRPQCEEQVVGHKHDVLGHESRVHSNKFYWQRVFDEAHFDLHRFTYDCLEAFIRELVDQVLVDQAGQVRVHALVPRDQLV